MPRAMVLAAWKTRFGDTRTRTIQPDDDALALHASRDLSRPFAGEFGVSVEAMRIRLEQLHLLRRVASAQRMLNPVL